MKIIIPIILLSFSFSSILNVPSELYSTIQAGIYSALEGDTVLVSPNDEPYFENLIIQKNITLASWAIFEEDLSDWVLRDPETELFEVENEYIANTTIDGSHDTNGENKQSVILINSPDNECIAPVIFGFTIQNGDGTLGGVEEETQNGRELVQKRLGGGIFSNNALPILNYNFIKDNNGDVQSGGIDKGGAYNNGTGVDLGEEFGRSSNNLRCEGVVDLSHNFYRDNEAQFGNTLATTDFSGSIDMTNSIFDVYAYDVEDISEYWVNVEEPDGYDASNGDGNLEAITYDVWVDPYTGVDEGNTIGNIDNPFQTINFAMGMIFPTEDNPITINLFPGTYSPSLSGEAEVISPINSISIIGSESTGILLEDILLRNLPDPL